MNPHPHKTIENNFILSMILAAVGSLLLYQTWTTLAFAVFAPFVLFRTRREEQTLAAEFDEEWQPYAALVPMFIPNWKIKSRENSP
ncbi:MAG: hypothetical protein Q8L41_14820 [Anaerolineales bacterium]|nr:hypothetical protein [Anaerolineales bacterium]